jgi:hypothetical protein
MSYWTTDHRKIDGHRRKVRLLHREGRIVSVRIAGRPHYTDVEARKRGLKREPGYVNYPNADKRRNYYR